MNFPQPTYAIFYIFQAFGQQHTRHYYAFDKPSRERQENTIRRITNCSTAYLTDMYCLDMADLTKTEKVK